MRDELQRQGETIKAANQRRADVKDACRLLRTYVATEAKLLRALDTHGGSCGVPTQVGPQVRASHAKAIQVAKQVCDAAGPRPFIIDPVPFKMGAGPRS